MKWFSFDDGKTIGQKGSENGIIVCDEEHCDGGRITLEKGGSTAPFAITCGIYGWMVHTRFFGTENEAQVQFNLMKEELSRIISTIPLAADPEVDSKSSSICESLSEFVAKFP